MSAEPRGHYWLGCSRCGRNIWLHSPKPRLPLCGNCRNKPTRKEHGDDD